MTNIYNSFLVDKAICRGGKFKVEQIENSLEAITEAAKEGRTLSLPLMKISDGTLIVFASETLGRLTGKDGYTKNLSKSELKDAKYGDSKQTIITLEEALKAINSKVPVLFEIISDCTDFVTNGVMERAFMETMKGFKNQWAIESSNPFVIMWFKHNAPEVIRGIKSGCFRGENPVYANKYKLMWLKYNDRCEPHFVNYCGRCLADYCIRRYVVKKRTKSIPLFVWKVGNEKLYYRLVKLADNIVYNGFDPSKQK
ncbi:MAG: hypothetical protein FWD89_04445 [Firmicutes bacterium]|nr:hypothetical protein [Bacillota bacterium]